MTTINEDIRNKSAAMTYMREHPHEALIRCCQTMMEVYDLDAQQVADLVRIYVVSAANLIAQRSTPTKEPLRAQKEIR